MKLLKRYLFCPMCGREEAPQRIVYTSLSPQAGNYNSDLGHPTFENTRYYVVECERCRSILLYSNEEKSPRFSLGLRNKLAHGNQLSAVYNDFNKAELLFPLPVSKEIQNMLPEKIGEKYTKALSLKNVDPGCFAVKMRITLEEVCKHYGQTGRYLEERLNKLFRAEKIPEQLREITRYVRETTNKAAHEGDIDAGDVPHVEFFLDVLLQYLFKIRPRLEESIRTGAADD